MHENENKITNLKFHRSYSRVSSFVTLDQIVIENLIDLSLVIRRYRLVLMKTMSITDHLTIVYPNR